MTQHGLRTSERPEVSSKLALVSENSAPIGGTITPRNVAQRNRGAIKLVEMQRHISSNSVPLLHPVAKEIGRRWLSGTQMAYLAKNFKLTIAQIEATVLDEMKKRLAMRAAAYLIVCVGIAQAATTQDASVSADPGAMWLMPIGLMLAAVRFAGTRKAVR